jgi:nucleotide-binding universal stress UspA family protein
VIVNVEKPAGGSADGIRDLARKLAWHGISAAFKGMPADGRSAALQLESAAADCDADLVVMDGYGHSRVRQVIFGGCTQHFLDHAMRRALIMH